MQDHVRCTSEKAVGGVADHKDNRGDNSKHHHAENEALVLFSSHVEDYCASPGVSKLSSGVPTR